MVLSPTATTTDNPTASYSVLPFQRDTNLPRIYSSTPYICCIQILVPSMHQQGPREPTRTNDRIAFLSAHQQHHNAAYSIAPRMKIDLIYHYGSEKCCNLAKSKAYSLPYPLHNVSTIWSPDGVPVAAAHMVPIS